MSLVTSPISSCTEGTCSLVEPQITHTTLKLRGRSHRVESTWKGGMVAGDEAECRDRCVRLLSLLACKRSLSASGARRRLLFAPA